MTLNILRKPHANAMCAYFGDAAISEGYPVTPIATSAWGIRSAKLSPPSPGSSTRFAPRVAALWHQTQGLLWRKSTVRPRPSIFHHQFHMPQLHRRRTVPHPAPLHPVSAKERNRSRPEILDPHLFPRKHQQRMPPVQPATKSCDITIRIAAHHVRPLPQPERAHHSNGAENAHIPKLRIHGLRKKGAVGPETKK